MTLLVLALVENSRIPVDDPTTHLELTMIHEVMVLDHSGPDLGLHPIRGGAEAVAARQPAGRARRAAAQRHRVAGRCRRCCSAWPLSRSSIGMIELAMARYRLIQVPQFIVGAATLSAVGFHPDPGLIAVFALLETIHALGLLSCFALLGTSRHRRLHPLAVVPGDPVRPGAADRCITAGWAGAPGCWRPATSR